VTDGQTDGRTDYHCCLVSFRPPVISVSSCYLLNRCLSLAISLLLWSSIFYVSSWW